MSATQIVHFAFLYGYEVLGYKDTSLLKPKLYELGDVVFARYDCHMRAFRR